MSKIGQYSNKLKIGESLLYLFVWTIILSVPALNTALTSKDHINLNDVFMSWLKLAPFFLVFLVHNYRIAPFALATRNYGRYVIAVVGLSLVIFISVDLLQRHVFLTLPVAPGHDEKHISFTDLNLGWNLLSTYVLCIANMGIKLIYKSVADDHLMEELRRQNMQVEMDYLRYQINPHFFMNILNSIHALIDIDEEAAKSTVIELSKMMRYVLYESGSKSISLERDLQFLDNYVGLMRVRFEDMMDINVNVAENLPTGVSIPPLLLVVFVENAFKHGVKASGDSFVNVDVKASGEQLVFSVVNSLATSRPTPVEDSATGIGLENVRKRLELIYGNKFELTADMRGDEYSVLLKIPLYHG